MDARTVTAEIQRKMDEGEALTQRNLDDLANAARMSGRKADQLLYISAKAYKAENNADQDPTAEEKKAQLVEELDLAREKAMRTSNQRDILAYVKAKQALAEANEEGDTE